MEKSVDDVNESLKSKQTWPSGDETLYASGTCHSTARPVYAASNWTSTADALLDRVQLGVELTFPINARQNVARFCTALARSGLLTRRPPVGAALPRRLSIGPKPIHLPTGGVATLGGRLDLVATEGGLLQVRRTSHLLPDAMRALRSQIEAPSALGTGGADNLAMSYDPEAYPALLAQQLCAVAHVVDVFVAALAEAAGFAPGRLRGKIWVQQAEFCRDYQHPEAEDFVRALKDRPIRGSRQERARFFWDQLGNDLCLSWHEGAKNSPERKVYAKRADCVRVEVSLRTRPAVKKLAAASGAPLAGGLGLSGASVARTLADLAGAAVPLLNQVVEVVNEGLTALPRTGLDFVLAFGPLSRLINPPPRAPGAAGRSRGADVEPLARLALDRLLAEGKFDMRGQSASNPVLLALKEMLAAGALSVTPERPRLFTVGPEMEAARQALTNLARASMGENRS